MFIDTLWPFCYSTQFAARARLPDAFSGGGGSEKHSKGAMAIQKTYARSHASSTAGANRDKVSPVPMIRFHSAAALFLICMAIVVEAGCHKGSISTVTINLDPNTTQSLDAGHQENFTATLAGDVENKGVRWSLTLNGVVCGTGTGSGCGSLSNVTNTSVTYTAPNVSAQTSFTLTATSIYDPVITSNVTITVDIAPQFTPNLTIPTSASNGVPYTAAVTAQYGVAPLTYYLVGVTSQAPCGIDGNLPCGLSLNPTSGQIVGTPTYDGAPNTSQTSSFTVQVTDYDGATAATPAQFSITVAAPTPIQASASLPQGFLGAPYSGSITSSGGVPPLIYGVSSGSLPPGITLNNSGQVTGTPGASANGTYPATYSFTVMITDSAVPAHQTFSLPASITINKPPTLSITTTTLPNGVTGSGYSALLQAQGGIPPYTWTLTSGQLPAGLTLISESNNTGLISGNPILGGPPNSPPVTSDFTVQVSDSDPTEDQPRSASLSIGISSGTNTNTLLSGSYSFLFQGFDSQGPVAIAGTLTADGNGNITSGDADVNRAEGITQGVRLGGTYSIGLNGADGRGVLHLIFSPNVQAPLDVDYQLVIQSDGSYRMIENDDTNTNTDTYATHGSGVLRPVTQASFTAGNLSGNYAFELSGDDYGGKRIAMGGVLHADGVSELTPIVGDLNDAGSFTALESPSGTFSYTASSLRGTATLLYSLAGKAQTQLQFAFYFVSAQDVYFVETDIPTPTDQFPRLSGEALLQQTGATFNGASFNGSSVVTGSGVNGSNASVMAGLLAAPLCDGATADASLSYDQNAGGTVTSVEPAASTCIVAATGRATFNNLDPRLAVAYLTGAGQGFILGSDAAVTTGLLELQTPMTYTSGMVNGSYALSASSAADAATPAIVGQVTSTGNSSLTGVLDEVDSPGKPAHLDQSLELTVESLAANGRGTISNSPPAGFPANLAFYMVSPTEIRMISLDSNPGNVHPDVISLNH